MAANLNNFTSAFNPDCIEEPKHIVRQGLLVVFLFFGIIGLWSAIGTISGAVVVPGIVKIDTERKTIQHLEGGIIDSIPVREGEKVVKGQALVILKNISTDASVVITQKKLISALASQARYMAEKNFSNIIWTDELLELANKVNSNEILKNEEKNFYSRKEMFDTQVSLLHSQILQVEAQIAGFREQETATTVIIRTLQEEYKAKDQLFQERYLEKSQILDLRRQIAMRQGESGRIRQAIAEARARKDELALRIEEIKSKFIGEATQELSRLENEILQLQEQILPYRDAQDRLRIVAPLSGHVVDLKVNSPGGVITPGMRLMDIVPEDSPLIIETHIPVNKVADIHLEQDAQVQMDAFDIRTTPLLQGKVSHISADRLNEETMAGIQPYYLCYIKVSPTSVREANIYLTPGMPATIFITTREKSILSYMLEPLLKNWDAALRE
jgi:HlyD family secretion protein/epimerase transport system membrane fusion protein